MVSITILLRKPMSGGYLEGNGKIVEFDVGDAIIFPSNVEHQVHHVAGVRESWWYGCQGNKKPLSAWAPRGA